MSNTTIGCPSLSESSLSVNLFEFIISGLIQGCVCLVGLLGNLLSFTVWSTERKSTTTNFMFRFLAVSDILFLAVVLVYSVLPTLHGYSGILPQYPRFLLTVLPYLWPVLWTSKALTVWTVVFIAIDRCHAVCHPLQTLSKNKINRVKIGCVGLVLAVTLYNIPHWFDIEPVDLPDPCTNTSIRSAAYTALLTTNRWYNVLYITLGEVIMFFAIPLTILSYCTYKLTRTLRRAHQFRSQMTAQKHGVKQRISKSVTRMLVAIVVVFMICETPQFVYAIMYFTATVDSSGTVYGFLFEIADNFHYVKLYKSLGDLFFTLNSGVNFFIYCIYGQRFRNMLWYQLTCHSQLILHSHQTRAREGRQSAEPSPPLAVETPNTQHLELAELAVISTSGTWPGNQHGRLRTAIPSSDGSDVSAGSVNMAYIEDSDSDEDEPKTGKRAAHKNQRNGKSAQKELPRLERGFGLLNGFSKRRCVSEKCHKSTVKLTTRSQSLKERSDHVSINMQWIQRYDHRHDGGQNFNHREII